MTGTKDTAAEIDVVLRELQSLRTEARRLGGELARTQREAAQARALAAEEMHEAARMERLERVLDLAAVTRHVRQAIDNAPPAGDLVRPVVVPDLLPAAVLQAAVDAIPAAVFRDPDSPNEISVPPPVGPTFVVATWMFLNDLAKDLIGPALIAQAPERVAGLDLDLKLVRSVLVPFGGPEPSERPPAQDEVLKVSVQLGEFDWRIGLAHAGRRASRPRRRHGDISSWAPRGK
jgi:hypothetical protein